MTYYRYTLLVAEQEQMFINEVFSLMKYFALFCIHAPRSVISQPATLISHYEYRQNFGSHSRTIIVRKLTLYQSFSPALGVQVLDFPAGKNSRASQTNRIEQAVYWKYCQWSMWVDIEWENSHERDCATTLLLAHLDFASGVPAELKIDKVCMSSYTTWTLKSQIPPRLLRFII